MERGKTISIEHYGPRTSDSTSNKIGVKIEGYTHGDYKVRIQTNITSVKLL